MVQKYRYDLSRFPNDILQYIPPPSVLSSESANHFVFVYTILAAWIGLVEHFTESVRKYPCLWKMDVEDYKNNEINEAACRNILECDITNGV